MSVRSFVLQFVPSLIGAVQQWDIVRMLEVSLSNDARFTMGTATIVYKRKLVESECPGTPDMSTGANSWQSKSAAEPIPPTRAKHDDMSNVRLVIVRGGKQITASLSADIRRFVQFVSHQIGVGFPAANDRHCPGNHRPALPCAHECREL